MSSQPAVPLVPGRPFHGLVQIAGVHDLQEAVMLAQAGADAIGFPLRLPVNAEDCTEAAAAHMALAIAPQATPVCICYLDRAEEIRQFCAALNMRHVQLHGDIGTDELKRLKKAAPELFVIKSLVIRCDTDNAAELEDRMHRMSEYVDAFITDTHNPATGADGATGMVHDWNISRRLVERSSRPVILAGGLTPDNVAEAICIVRPAGVDAHTGLEDADGRKDRNLSLRFIRNAKQALATFSAIIP
jgi:phosphoribosylanthranilate isomerase